MESMWNIYHENVPEFIAEFAQTPAMLRLKGIGMHCGCEYTDFPQYAGTKPYSRWTHSIGVALIVWHFTGNMAQTVAGLLHDVASPTFAHVIDFLHGDHINQESTEEETEAIIARSPELTALLDKYGLTVAQVSDYHLYPVADNDSPRLSADRLEYTLGNGLNHNICNPDELRAIYDDLTVAENEEGQPEIQFRTPEHALRFARISLTNSRVYAGDGNRYSMQALAELLRDAIANGIVAERDLYATEAEVIAKLCTDARLAARWEKYTRYSALKRSAVCPDDGGYWLRLDAKRRSIDPKVLHSVRVTALDPGYRAELEQFRTEPYDYWMCAVEE